MSSTNVTLVTEPRVFYVRSQKAVFHLVLRTKKLRQTYIHFIDQASNTRAESNKRRWLFMSGRWLFQIKMTLYNIAEVIKVAWTVINYNFIKMSSQNCTYEYLWGPLKFYLETFESAYWN